MLRSSKGKGSKSAKRKGNDSNEGDKENVPVSSHGVKVIGLANHEKPPNPEVKVNFQFLPPMAHAQPIRGDLKGVPVKVYSKYP